MLFGPNEIFKGTIIEKLYWFITEGALQYLLKLYQIIFRKEFNVNDNVIFRIIYKCRYRFIQAFYLTISTSGIIFFFYTALDRLPNKYLGPIHFVIIPMVIAFLYISFYVACVSDPGVITKENVDAVCKHFKYDYILFSERTCKTCNLIKPARSKHCSSCGHCIAKSDHHCSWINNCVGYLNFRYFLLFLIANVIICLYGCYLCTYLIKARGDSLGLDTGYAINRFTRQLEKIGLKEYSQIMLKEEPILSGLVLFLGASNFIVLGFILYQSYLNIVDGTTSNELAKWGRLENRLMKGETFITKTYVGDQEIKENKKESENKNEKNEKNEQINKNYSNNTTKQRKEKESKPEMTEFYDGIIKNGYRYSIIRSFDDVTNIYNQGIKNNFKEMIFPNVKIFKGKN
ncbi:zf-DHHC-domain-containing protein [Neocallimastix sp. 'constans']